MKKTLKVRTPTEVYKLVTEDLAWRRIEITTLRSSINKSTGIKQDTFIRAGVTILYAHWEGFVRYAANVYASYLTTISLKHNEIHPCFLSIPMKEMIDTVFESKKPYKYAEVLDKISKMREEKVSIKIGRYIENVGNMNHDLFIGIISALGIDKSSYMSKEQLIDETLLGARNAIAHGQYLQIDCNGFLSTANNILQIMEALANDITNACTSQSYRITPATQAPQATTL